MGRGWVGVGWGAIRPSFLDTTYPSLICLTSTHLFHTPHTTPHHINLPAHPTPPRTVSPHPASLSASLPVHPYLFPPYSATPTSPTLRPILLAHPRPSPQHLPNPTPCDPIRPHPTPSHAISHDLLRFVLQINSGIVTDNDEREHCCLFGQQQVDVILGRLWQSTGPLSGWSI